MGKSGSQKTKTTQTATPWQPQADALKGVFGTAANVYGQNNKPNANLQAGWDMARANAIDPNSGFNKAKGYYKGVIDSGGYDPNVWANISSPVIAGVTSQFMGSGRTGSGLEGIDLTNELTKAYAPFAINQVNNAASALPMIDANAANGLAAAGQQEFGLPWDALNNYYGIIGGGNWGGTTNGVTKTPAPSMWQQIGGAALGGLGTMAKLYGG